MPQNTAVWNIENGVRLKISKKIQLTAWKEKGPVRRPFESYVHDYMKILKSRTIFVDEFVHE